MTSTGNLLELTQEIIRKAQEQGIEIEGPGETEYGYGWMPTVTIWRNKRRVHMHYRFSGSMWLKDQRKDAVTFEIAYLDNQLPPSRTPITTSEEAWDLTEKFLIQGLTTQDIPREWVSDTADTDKFIPHPASVYNPANIASVLSQGNWTPWVPPEKKSTETKPPEKKRRNFFFRWFGKG